MFTNLGNITPAGATGAGTTGDTSQTNTQAAATVATGANTQQVQPQTQQAAALDMDAIAAKAAEIAAKKEQAVMKSFFEQNGLSREDAEKALADYKAQKQKQEEADKNDAAKQMQKQREELAALKAELEAERYSKNISELCKALDVKDGREQFISKFLNQSELMKNGTFDKDAATKAINSILEALPEFKKVQTEPSPQTPIGGAIKIGAPPQTTPNTTATMTPHQKFAAHIAANKK